MDRRSLTDGELEDLITRYGDGILRLCRMILGNQALAEDAWQETWIKVWKKHGTFRGESSEKTWIIRIAVNTCRDLRRSSWVRVMWQSSGEEALESVPALEKESPGPVFDAIDHLSPKVREAVTLYYLQEMSIREVSEVLHITQSAAEARVRRGREQIKAYLKGEAEHA